MIANIGGGMLMWLVHFLNKFLPEGDYGIFGTLLSVVMLLPTIPLQMVFAQQTAKAIATNRIGELSNLIRRAWAGTLVLWLVGVVALVFLQGWILQNWHLTQATGLWITMVAVLLSIWMPIFWGVLQGQQNFLWLGWSMLSNGIGRLTVSSLAVMVLYHLGARQKLVPGTYAAGMVIGVVAGLGLAVAISVWQTRRLWSAPIVRFDWRSLSRQVVPLLLAFFGFQVLFTADTLFVKSYFSGQETDFYVSAGTLSRALMWLVGPLAAVMFPRLVQSAAKGEKQDLMGLVLLGTGILAAVGAIGLSLLGPIVLEIVYRKSFIQGAAGLLPWYAGAMVPLSVANVLLNNLLAKPSSKGPLGTSVFSLSVLYAFALTQWHGSLVQVLQVVCLFNTVLLAICAWFTWREKRAGTVSAVGA